MKMIVSVTINKVLLEHSPALSFESSVIDISMSALAAFMLHRHSSVAAVETMGPAEPGIFAIWPFTENVCQPLI